MLANEKLWEAVASLAWPFLALFVFMRIFPTVKGVLADRRFTMKVAGMEISVAEAAESFGQQIVRIEEKIAEFEKRLTPLPADAIVAEPEKRTRGGERVPRRLLWVDDYPVNNAFLIEKFEREGIELEKALSTEEAVRKLSYFKYAAIITDLGRRENGIDNRFAGMDLIRLLRSGGNQTPILVFAGQRGLEHREKLIEAGANGVTASGSDVIAFVEQYVPSNI